MLSIGLAWLYAWLHMHVIGWTSVRVLTPHVVHAAMNHGGPTLLRIVMYAIDLSVTLVVSLPFAVIIALICKNGWLEVALVTCGYLALSELSGIPMVWGHIADHGRYLTNLVAGTVTLVAVLPMLTFLARRLTPNYRLDRTGGW